MNQIIIDAIKTKRCLGFVYDGFSRVAEPHTYGLSKKGEELLRAYQISGGHASGHDEFWHLFSVSKMMSLVISQQSFAGPRSGYKKGDPAMDHIFAEL